MPSPLATLPPRWRKVLRDLARSKARTALVVLSIAVGVLAVGAIMTTRLILNHDLAIAYRGTNPQHATLSIAEPFGDDLVRLARRVDGVADAEAMGENSVRVKVGPDQWRQLRLTGRQDYENLRLNKIDPESGDWPPPRHEVLIERNSF